MKLGQVKHDTLFNLIHSQRSLAPQVQVSHGDVCMHITNTSDRTMHELGISIHAVG